jgi:hypothetical protein
LLFVGDEDWVVDDVGLKLGENGLEAVVAGILLPNVGAPEVVVGGFEPPNTGELLDVVVD